MVLALDLVPEGLLVEGPGEVDVEEGEVAGEVFQPRPTRSRPGGERRPIRAAGRIITGETNARGRWLGAGCLGRLCLASGAHLKFLQTHNPTMHRSDSR
jgi:hypothetical protein